MREYTDGYAVQVNWESESIKTENYVRAFCMSDNVTGGNCWTAVVPPGRDVFSKFASFTMTMA